MSDEDGVQAVDARMNLKCSKHSHPIVQLWQTSPGVDPQVVEEDGRVGRWEVDGGIFDRLCPECEKRYGSTMMYGRAVESLMHKFSEVPRGTVGEWTLLHYEVNADT